MPNDAPLMDVTFVGSGDAFGSGGRYQTCIQLRTRAATLLVDCGATSLTALRGLAADVADVDAVLISHLHGDHFGGLPFLVLDAQFSTRTKPLRVIGPMGTRKRLMAAMEVLFPGSSTVHRRFDVRVDEVVGNGAAIEVCDAYVRVWEVDHASGAPAHALRVDVTGRSFGYSGDTAWTDNLQHAARGTDLFACEAYTYEKSIRYHLSYRTLEAHAPELETERLVLTHMGDDMLQRADDTGRIIAQDGMRFTL